MNIIQAMISEADSRYAVGCPDLIENIDTLASLRDASIMFSPDMFAEFVLPALREQMAWADNVIYHLDGPGAVCHLDHLLSIPELDCIQWTPGAGAADTDDPVWFPMYRKILGSGKSLQIFGVHVSKMKTLINECGGKGLFLGVREINTIMDQEYALSCAQPYRRT